jgi:hypothetical protein
MPINIKGVIGKMIKIISSNTKRLIFNLIILHNREESSMKDVKKHHQDKLMKT